MQKNELEIFADALDKYIDGDKRKSEAAGSIMGLFSMAETITILEKAGDRLIEVVYGPGYDNVEGIYFIDSSVPGKPRERYNPH